jgi:hypothetical protein
VITSYGTNDDVVLGTGAGAVGNLDGRFEIGIVNGAGQTLNARRCKRHALRQFPSEWNA